MADEPAFSMSDLIKLKEAISLGISREKYLERLLGEFTTPDDRLNAAWPSPLDSGRLTYFRLAQINHSRKYAGRPAITEADLRIPRTYWQSFPRYTYRPT